MVGGGEPNFLLVFAGARGVVLDSGSDELDALDGIFIGVAVGFQPINQPCGFRSGHATFLHLLYLLPGMISRLEVVPSAAGRQHHFYQSGIGCLFMILF